MIGLFRDTSVKASLKLDCDVDSCVSCTILNFKKEEYDEGLALFCDKILGCCFDTFGDKLDNVIGDYEALKRKELTPEMKKYLHQKMKGPSEKVIEVKEDQDGNIIYGVYSEDVDEEENNKFKLGAKHVDEL
ncbi:Oidioi.mRNA.OKI2018_I69.XSR.g13540.t1.cds [Oikopleura dioica]|uniref:Oidioi.mRNA.OKI2018_I69.XSR.g13540.t1.cds n=1 Tax=Oikopleura dioica TaxID=34765 RepID=A0ABN7SE37_OIKDI|nr:Oidioi.mRNA.OKI2018_I69.XSR.g13540.t1.cds [Oikopleura dioica]